MLLLGANPLSRFPALVGSLLTEEGILKITQCHQPLPVGASGSYTVTAKLFVSRGAFRHWSSGEILPPVQPKPEYTCSLPIFPFSFRTGLTKLKSAARHGKAMSTKTNDNQNRNISLLLS